MGETIAENTEHLAQREGGAPFSHPTEELGDGT
jgi:hypothetical protein